MAEKLQQAAAFLFLYEDPSLLFTAFHTVVLELRSLFLGRLPLSQIIPDDHIATLFRNILGEHVQAADQAYNTYLGDIEWKNEDFPGTTQRVSSLRTLQGLFNDLGWYSISQGGFLAECTARMATHHIARLPQTQEWAVQNLASPPPSIPSTATRWS
jgi:hypothetical protein